MSIGPLLLLPDKKNAMLQTQIFFGCCIDYSCGKLNEKVDWTIMHKFEIAFVVSLKADMVNNVKEM